jgi:hypothetical protein
VSRTSRMPQLTHSICLAVDIAISQPETPPCTG